VVNLACERSYENPFARFGATRVDSQIDFAPSNWDLTFINSSRYDYYDWEPGNILRDRLPLEATWTGTVVAAPGQRLAITYVGSGEITVGGEHVVLGPTYDRVAHVEVPLPEGISTLQAAYLFDDGSRSGQDPELWGPRATFALFREAGGQQNPLPSAPVPFGWSLLAGLGDALMVALLLLIVIVLVSKLMKELAWLVVMGVATSVIVLLPLNLVISQLALAGLAVALFVVQTRWRWFSLLFLYMVLVILSLGSMRAAYPRWDYVVYRTAGNDNLTAESQAQSILQTGSLEGGEAVFYAQPFYRYAKFIEHVLFGDGDVLYASFQLAALLAGVFAVLTHLAPQPSRGWKQLTLVLAGAGLLGICAYYAAGFIRDGLPEYLTWTAIFWAVLWLLSESRWELVCAGAILGLASIVRSNQIPGNALVLALGLLLARRSPVKWRLASGTLFLATMLLPLLHNWYYGHSLVITTTSAQAPTNLILGPSFWSALAGGQGKALRTLIDQARLLFFFVPLDRGQIPVAMSAQCLLGLWMGVGIWRGLRGFRWRDLWLGIPVVYLLTQVVFAINTYYPRHIIIAYLAMGISVLIALWNPVGWPAGQVDPKAFGDQSFSRRSAGSVAAVE
jgi:hypothetical protein